MPRWLDIDIRSHTLHARSLPFNLLTVSQMQSHRAWLSKILEPTNPTLVQEHRGLVGNPDQPCRRCFDDQALVLVFHLEAHIKTKLKKLSREHKLS